MPRFYREYAEAVVPVAAATLKARGVTSRMLDGPHWRRTAHGFYVPAGMNPPIADTPTQRIVEAAAGLPPGALGGWAAAYACGVDALDGGRGTEPVIVVVPPKVHRTSRIGMRYVRAVLRPSEVHVLANISFTRPLRTALDLARWAPELTEAVVCLDAMIAGRVTTRDALLEAATRLAGRRGSEQARRAVGLCRGRTRSPWESRLRMVYVLDLALPTPSINVPVFDLDGNFLGAPDLLDEEAGLVLEFDGAQHRERAQHRADNVREEGFERSGLVVVRADSIDLGKHCLQLRSRITEARCDGLRRDRRRDRWTTVEPANWRGLPA